MMVLGSGGENVERDWGERGRIRGELFGSQRFPWPGVGLGYSACPAFWSLSGVVVAGCLVAEAGLAFSYPPYDVPLAGSGWGVEREKIPGDTP